MVHTLEMPRLHRYLFWLGIYWGAWSIVLFLFNPIGDELDTYRDRDSQIYSVCELIDTVANRRIPPFNSVQCLVGIHAPILALFAVLRHRWTVYGGTGCGLAYLIFMIAMSLDRWLADDLLNATKSTALVRSIVAILWCAPAIPLMLQMEQLRKAGIRYQRDFADPQRAFAFGGRVVNYRLVSFYSACLRLMPWLWLVIGILHFGAILYEIMDNGLVNANEYPPLFVAFMGAFSLLGGIAIVLAALSYFKIRGTVVAPCWLTYLAVATATLSQLNSLPGHSFLSDKMILLGLCLTAIAFFTAMLAVAFLCIKRAGLPLSIRVSDLTEVERAEIAEPNAVSAEVKLKEYV